MVDDIKKFLDRSRTTSDLIAREEYEIAIMLALECVARLEGELALEDRNIPTLGARITQLEADNAALKEKLSATQEFAKSCVENCNRQFEEIEALQKQVGGLREANSIAEEYGPIGAPEVHRAWRDMMLSQGRGIKTERMNWRKLPTQDKQLDEQIASAIVEDFLVWFFAHKALEAGGE